MENIIILVWIEGDYLSWNIARLSLKVLLQLSGSF